MDYVSFITSINPVILVILLIVLLAGAYSSGFPTDKGGQQHRSEKTLIFHRR
ncbi:hypothetical protein [Rhizobium sp. AN95]|uniref:hypothetical protein n=1 Tax=Rhizobium sp. AN95 TaxID=3035216 RepID=UPI002B25CDF8|nr:hypothetical protein [Rhizobium sp. AN95]